MPKQALYTLVLTTLLVFDATSAPSTQSSSPPATSETSSPVGPSASIRGWLEVAAFAASCLTAGIALIALYQLKLARGQLDAAMSAVSIAQKDIQVRSRREAVSLAAARCEDLANAKFPKILHALNFIQGQKVNLKAWDLQNKAFDSTSVVEAKEAEAWVVEFQNRRLHAPALDILNQLEGFAIYFISGAADEEVAFPVAGIPFCHYVRLFAPYLIAVRNGQLNGVTSGKFDNTVKLFELWVDRIRREQIEAQTKIMQKELKTLKSGGVSPIGTG